MLDDQAYAMHTQHRMTIHLKGFMAQNASSVRVSPCRSWEISSKITLGWSLILSILDVLLHFQLTTLTHSAPHRLVSPIKVLNTSSRSPTRE